MPTNAFLDGYLPYVLRRADQALSSEFYEVLGRYGVARSEWRVLAVLHDLGEHSILDLTTAALSPQPTITHAVRRLEERELVTRVLGTADKRQRFVSITATGKKLTKALVAEAEQLQTEALSQSDDLAGLLQQLQHLTDVVSEGVARRRQDQAHAG